jgi:hypothetical protein
VFTRSLGIKRNAVVLPGYELVSCNVPAQVATGRRPHVVSFVNTFRARRRPSSGTGC